MLVRNRLLTVLLAANYLLAVGTAALFHSHHDHDEEQRRPGLSAAHAVDDHECSICQFLAQKPVPVAPVSPPSPGMLVQGVAALVPVCVVGAVFTAWHSRAPPSLG